LNPSFVFEKITVIAPGLLGASIGMAAHNRGLAKRISVWARRPEAREQLAQTDWCNQAPKRIEDACSGSEFIILCAPVQRIIDLAKTIAPHLDSNPIVTDVGSVKSELSRACTSALSSQARFVGSHPMAGSEKTGMENADSELFVERVCFVTPFEDTDPDATQSVSKFWQALGSSTISETPERHDAIVANVSHLPHLLASALATHLSNDFPDAAKFCGNGLKDTTRIASGDPGMWREIIAQNRTEILRSIDAFQDELQELRSVIANENDFETLVKLANGKTFRDSLDD
jgi:cyclohexadieny/prephenate dehydrogenase|tara:strand:+ start:139 stop:1002 length:864 start_codon:yes stop_codon:yes gene_type:complete